MIGCGNPMREAMPVVLDRIRRELATGSGRICVCMELTGRVVLTGVSAALPDELLITVTKGDPGALHGVAEAVAAEIASRFK